MVRFSLKRASGLTGARQSFARETGIRTTKGGGTSTGSAISVIIGMAVIFWLISLFCGCDQSPDYNYIAEELENRLNAILAGQNPSGSIEGEYDMTDEAKDDFIKIEAELAGIKASMFAYKTLGPISTSAVQYEWITKTQTGEVLMSYEDFYNLKVAESEAEHQKGIDERAAMIRGLLQDFRQKYGSKE